MADRDDKRLNRRQWLEIAAMAFIVALILWLLRNAFGVSVAPNNDAAFEAPPESDTDTPSTNGGDTFNIPAFQPIGIPPLQLPGTGGDCCGCGGCSVGSSGNNSGINDIIANTNTAIAALQSESTATLNAIAQYGDEGSGGYNTYDVDTE